jgi:hypothetical protein
VFIIVGEEVRFNKFLSICRLMPALHVHSIRVRFAWYPWYQSSSVALECLSIEFIECSILSGTIGRVPVNSAECQQHDFDADRCTSVAKCDQSLLYCGIK